jgi:hypothetical protein
MKRPADHRSHRPREHDEPPMPHHEPAGLDRYARGGARRGRYVSDSNVAAEAEDGADQFAQGGTHCGCAACRARRAELKAHGGKSHPRADKRARGGAVHHSELHLHMHPPAGEDHGGAHRVSRAVADLIRRSDKARKLVARDFHMRDVADDHGDHEPPHRSVGGIVAALVGGAGEAAAEGGLGHAIRAAVAGSLAEHAVHGAIHLMKKAVRNEDECDPESGEGCEE